MKRSLFFLILFVFSGSLISQIAKPDVIITSNSYRNWTFSSGVTFTITLYNNGDATAKDIMLKVEYTISNGTYVDQKNTTLDWGETLLPTKEKTKIFKIKLPKGYDVTKASITILSQ